MSNKPSGTSRLVNDLTRTAKSPVVSRMENQEGYTKDSKIIIVGAGVFGLSNALHLAKNGYKDITVYDRLDMNSNHYTFLEGADTASADLNKIFRAEYAEKVHYQELALEAQAIWQVWNRQLALVPPEEAKKYTNLLIFDQCSMLRLDDCVGWEEISSRDNFAKAGIASLRYDLDSPEDMRRAFPAGLSEKIKYVDDLKARGLRPIHGALDTTSGVLYASRGCQFAKYLCESMGVKFVVGGDQGKMKSFIESSEGDGSVRGIVTMDGVEHPADLVIVAAGPWSTSLVGELEGINEASSGNVMVFKIPEGRKDLYEKYRSRNFPIVAWKSGHSREKDYLGGMFMFPVAEPEGYMKMIIRQTKYTNPVTLENGRVVSVPWTARSEPPAVRLTSHITDQAISWLKLFFPDLVDAGIHLEPKIIWYTDTINNDYIYDFVPGKKNVFVSTGGSGHAFKMLPVLGKFLVDKIEGRSNFYTDLFRWREARDFSKDPNGLGEGTGGPRVYAKQKLADIEDYKLNLE